MSKVPETYLYEIRNNRRVIKLDHGVEINTPRSLYLTKDDVRKCLEVAYVFRRFANHEPVQVTVTNLDRLHNAKFISEEEWETKAVVEEVVSEPIEETIETPVQVEPEVAVEESEIQEQNSVEPEIDNNAIVEEDVEEVESDVTVNTDENEDAINDDVETGDDDETGGVSETESTQTQPNKGNYTYKKHNKKRH